MIVKDVFISSISFRVPGVRNPAELKNSDPIFETASSVIGANNKSIKVGLLDLNSKSKNIDFMPKKSDAKIMRPDVIASTICAQELIQGIELTESDWKNTSFYMANGFCLDRLSDQIQEMSAMYLKPDGLEENMNKEQIAIVKNQALSRFTPPLFVLNALTNAAQSFCSQYGGFKYDNTTLGNTSQSTIYNLEEACLDIMEGFSDRVVVGSSNGAGFYSGFSKQNRTAGELFESEASAFLLLESKKSLQDRGAKPLARISFLEDSKTIPKLFSANDFNEDQNFLERINKSEVCYYSGVSSKADFEEQTELVKKFYPTGKSLFQTWGNFGVSSQLIDIIHGISDKTARFDCYNRDLYGRSSIITVEVIDD